MIGYCFPSKGKMIPVQVLIELFDLRGAFVWTVRWKGLALGRFPSFDATCFLSHQALLRATGTGELLPMVRVHLIPSTDLQGPRCDVGALQCVMIRIITDLHLAAVVAEPMGTALPRFQVWYLAAN
jgi:hypothetical protein